VFRDTNLLSFDAEEDSGNFKKSIARPDRKYQRHGLRLFDCDNLSICLVASGPQEISSLPDIIVAASPSKSIDGISEHKTEKVSHRRTRL
jgi:hypothetical protein